MQTPQATFTQARKAFARRLAICVGLAGILIAVSLFVGVAGYHFLEGMSWTDAFADATRSTAGWS
jgi:hypothetical protein